ncbi:mercury resistance system transport protein MerF [Candidatus Nitrospira bockiana]
MEEQKKPDSRLLWTGLVGSATVALCCFTPFLAVTLGVLGLGALTGYLDYVLLPALAVFAGIALYGIARQRPAGKRACCAEHPSLQ